MLEHIRIHKKLILSLLLLIIVPSFVFLGTESYTRMSNSEDIVAEVAGRKISIQEFNYAYDQHLKRLKNIFGDQFNSTFFDTKASKSLVLDDLILKYALSKYATDHYLTVSDDKLRKTIMEIDGLINPDGGFDKEKYLSILSSQGLTPQQFDQSLRHDLTIQQINNIIQSTSLSSKFLLGRINEINQEMREIEEKKFLYRDYLDKVVLKDNLLKEFYKKNIKKYQIPEIIKAEYIILDMDSIISKIELNDMQINEFYKNNMNRYKTNEQRRASHILISFKDKESESKILEKAKKILKDVKNNPDNFAEFAKEFSDDFGSSDKGGDLDFFSRGVMTESFDNAAFKMKKNEISDLVKSEFGFHIIKLTDIAEEKKRTLSEVKDSISLDLKKELGKEKFSKMKEDMKNIVYEQPENFFTAADSLNLKIEIIDGLTRIPNQNLDNNATYNQSKFLAEIFSDESINDRINTTPIEFNNKIISGRILEYKPITNLPFEEVKDEIKLSVSKEKAEELAKIEGEINLENLKNGGEINFEKKITVSRNNPLGLPKNIVSKIMSIDRTKLPSYVGIKLKDEGYRIYKVSKVIMPTNGNKNETLNDEQLKQFVSNQENRAYLNKIKKNAKFRILNFE